MADPRLIFDVPPGDLSLDDVLKAIGGRPEPELRRVAEQLREMEPEIRDWLAEHPDRLTEFVRNPARVLMRAFPNLDIPSRLMRRPERLPRDLDFEIVPRQPPSPAMNLFAAVWQWIAASQQNTQAFDADPAAVVRSVGVQVGANQATIGQVVVAVDQTQGVYHLQTGGALSALNYAVWKGQLP